MAPYVAIAFTSCDSKLYCGVEIKYILGKRYVVLIIIEHGDAADEENAHLGDAIRHYPHCRVKHPATPHILHVYPCCFIVINTQIIHDVILWG